MMTPATNRAYNPRARVLPDGDAVVREPNGSGNGVRFHIVGTLVEHAARLLRQRVLDDLHEGHRTFVFDLEHAQSFDNGALGVLVSIMRRIHDAGADVDFENVTEPVRTLFALMRLDQLFPIRDGRRTPVSRRTPASSSVISINQRRKTP